jgi:tRNA(Ile)-lysidine synthase
MAGTGRLTALTGEVLGLVRIPSGPSVVALSGGPDSAVCAWAACRSGGPVRAVHVDHGLAGSPGLRAAAVAIADALEIPLDVVEVTVDAVASPEDAARRARYRALERSLRPGEVLLTGHTRSDHAETVLGNVLRGAGLDGLSGIPFERGRILRPLLEVTGAQTRELATLLGLPWREDPVNMEEGPRRNLLRHRIIPLIEATVNPSLEASLATTAHVLSFERELADGIADRVPWSLTDGEVRLPAPLLATLPVAVAARVIRRALRALAGPYGGEARDVGLVLDVAAGSIPRAMLGGGVHTERDRAMVVLHARTRQAIPDPVEWALPGIVRFGPWLMESWIDTLAPAAFPPDRFREVFDAAAVSSSLLVRTAEGTDRISFKGGSKPVSEAFAEAGIPREERLRRPVVSSPQGVLWMPGVRRADLGWVDSTTTRYLWVRATREDV